MITNGNYEKYLNKKIDWEMVWNNPGGDHKVKFNGEIERSKPVTVFGVMKSKVEKRETPQEPFETV